MRRGEDGGHAEFSAAGFAGRDLGGRLSLASWGQKRQIMRPTGTSAAASAASKVLRVVFKPSDISN